MNKGILCESISFPGWEGLGNPAGLEQWPSLQTGVGVGVGLILGSPTLICKVLGESTLS